MTTTHKQSEIPKDLEEAAEKYFIKVPCSEEVKKTLIEIYKPGIDAYIAGGKWQKEQMMEEAVEARVIELGLGDTPHIILGLSDKYKDGDKVQVIVCKKED